MESHEVLTDWRVLRALAQAAQQHPSVQSVLGASLIARCLGRKEFVIYNMG